MARIKFPESAKRRGPGFWVYPSNLLAARRKFLRSDASVHWRDAFDGWEKEGDRRSVPFSRLCKQSAGAFKFLVLGDTGEGDHSQYSLLPLIRALDPDFMIIAGDVAYPAGNLDDFDAGFFAPYAGLNIPIWAVPGNHEYYSSGKGREFYDIFCTNLAEGRWHESGLRFVKQPGTYWELKEEGNPLVVIGVDSLKKGDLDGNRWKPADVRQLQWLEWRLQVAEAEARKVVVLFHIPPLVNARPSDIAARRLLRLLRRFSCVRLVVAADTHNYQQYDAATFGRFLDSELADAGSTATPPVYVVNGGGGAYITGTDFDGPFGPAERFPSAQDWRDHMSLARRAIDRRPWLRRTFGRLGSMISSLEDPSLDPDQPEYLSMLMVESGPAGPMVTPVFMRHVGRLFSHLPEDAIVDIQSTSHKPDRDEVKRCLRPPFLL